MIQILVEKRLDRFKTKWKWHHLSQLNGFLKYLHMCEKEKLKEVSFLHLLYKNDFTMNEVMKYEAFFDEDISYKICASIDVNDNLIEIMNDFPEFPWNMRALSANKSITLDFIIKNPQLNWDYVMMSLNPTIKLKDILANHKYLPWNWIEFSVNDELTIEMIKSNLDLPWSLFYCCGNINIPVHHFLECNELWDVWSWISLSTRLDLDISHILNYQDAPWDWTSLARNPKINASVLMFFPQRIPKTEDIWESIPWNQSITIHQVIKNLDLNWDWYDLSIFISDTNAILYNLDLPWQWANISKNAFIDIDKLIELHPKKLIWSFISKNPAINWKTVKKYREKPWMWKRLSENISIDLFTIANNPDEPWHWGYVSKRTSPYIAVAYPHLPWNWRLVSDNVTNIKIVYEYPNMPWNWKSLSRLKNLKFDDIIRNLDKDWSWKELSKNANIFNVCNSDLDFINFLREKNAANTIKRKWHLINNNPEYVVARKRIGKMFDDLQKTF